ncbi:putative N-acetylmannosamine-6-phosphate 2-epimerase [Phytoactinopolyspora halotolerans]|uniref:N-acylglucosamine-6-phosphate 2-epimerase n=1 Tax=Phytoactinopolyspora halotolerans TaxID=1981512 RepID=A0A6L9SDA7_9ACTN|nr:putative N-acetylmannosamine-6-phosphate 2-epimerase [Phytoactinopolyspora halotolerans]NEE02000.1 putative N-acetylmannosamine-6-phosphate 2-epimerase [Phytoactinopolyspora halotolerans]
MNALDRIRGGLVVSCQPLPDEPDDPMRDAYVQARVAAGVVRGGAVGVRVNGVDDIVAVAAVVDVPIIGLVKDGPGPVVITPTVAHAVAAAEAGATVVAIDATDRPRPDGSTFAEAAKAVHARTSAMVMADVATVDEGLAAADAGADAIATTLSGFTGSGSTTDGPDLDLLAQLVARSSVPVMAEGRYRCAEDVTRALSAGAHAVVVGNAITSPLWITRSITRAVRAGAGGSAPGA